MTPLRACINSVLKLHPKSAVITSYKNSDNFFSLSCFIALPALFLSFRGYSIKSYVIWAMIARWRSAHITKGILNYLWMTATVRVFICVLVNLGVSLSLRSEPLFECVSSCVSTCIFGVNVVSIIYILSVHILCFYMRLCKSIYLMFVILYVRVCLRV